MIFMLQLLDVILTITVLILYNIELSLLLDNVNYINGITQDINNFFFKYSNCRIIHTKYTNLR